MPNPVAKIIFRVPEDRLGTLITALENFPAESDDLDLSDLTKIDTVLMAAAGNKVTIELDEPDPLTAMIELTNAMDFSNTPYWAVFDSFAEPARGVRVTGRVMVSMGGASMSKDYRWEFGAPDFDIATLLKAGIAEENANVIDRFFFDEPKTSLGPR